ncbi:TetR/AcrR family transcriptional regulator [Cupriavidus gilardii]|nr:TetR/AcrR family transcriptional regulator [Cupriavidus gilardii]MCT9115763.1 TetR/AcrR family transcriptional regulator [Cupriavidus gilardii]
MQKGQLTRSAIIAQAFDTATRIGFEQLSLAELAASTDMSKSGLYAHFKSKEALQQAVLELAIERFTAMVVQPALRQPRGVPRLRALFEGQLEWIGSTDSGGRCLFMALGQEYRDRPGVIRDMLVRALKDWNGIVVRVAADAIQDGSLGADEEPRQIAFEMAGIVMAFQQSLKMLGRADAQAMARRAFQSVVTRGKRTA